MTTTTQSGQGFTTALNPTALAIAFGVAGLVVAIVFASVTGGMWGMMGGNGGWMNGGWMHGPGGVGTYGGPMMGGGLGIVSWMLLCGFLGGALAGGVSAVVYNTIAGRNA